jgi:hypothetical protein
MDFVFNGEGANPRDLLTLALLYAKGYFGWINHTFSHENLDNLSQAALVDQIKKNIDFATANRLPNFDATELVTGEHSGLANPAMPAALATPGRCSRSRASVSPSWRSACSTRSASPHGPS